jgi:twitching motility protein PilT
MQTGRKLGMVTLSDALLELVTKGLVEPEEAAAKALDRAEFTRLLESRNIKIDGGPQP